MNVPVHEFVFGQVTLLRCGLDDEQVRRYAGNGVLMLMWFSISSTIILVIKVLVSGVPPRATPSGETPAPAQPPLFPYPLTITMTCQFVVCVMACIVSRIRCCAIVWPTRQQIIKFALPIGALTAVEIGCTNYALKILHFSFAQILKCGGTDINLQKYRCMDTYMYKI